MAVIRTISANCGANSGYNPAAVVYIDVDLVSQNTAARTSTVRFIARWARLQSGTSGTFTGTLAAGGQSWSVSAAVNTNNTSGTLITTGNVTIQHKSDGTGAVGAKLTGSPGTNSWASTLVQNGSMALPKISAASNPSLTPATLTLGESTLIKTHRASTGFTHDLTWACGSKSGTIVTGLATDYTWTPPLAEICQALPTSVTGTVTVTCVTKQGTTVIGTTTTSLTVAVPETVVPTLTGITVSDPNGGLGVVGALVQNFSLLRITGTGAAGIHGSTIVGYEFAAAGISKQGVGATADFNVTWGTAEGCLVRCVDSRGRRSALRSAGAGAVPYTAPKTTLGTARRANSAGVETQLGTFAATRWSGQVASIVYGGTQKNSFTRKIRWRKKGVGAWTETVIASNQTPGSWVNQPATIGAGLLDVGSAYEVEFIIADKFQAVTHRVEVSVSAVALSISPSGTGHGKVWQRGALDVGGDAYVEGGLYVDGNTKTRTAAGSFVKTVSAGTSWVTGTFPTFPYRHLIMVWNGDAGAQRGLYVIGGAGQMNDTLGGDLDFRIGGADAGPARFSWIAVPRE